MDNITAVAVIIYSAAPATQRWNGEAMGFQEALKQNEHNAVLALRQAQLLHDKGMLKSKAAKNA